MYYSSLKECYISCIRCTDEKTIQNTQKLGNLCQIKEKYCLHAKLCELLFSNQTNSIGIQQCHEESFIEVLKEDKKEIITIVYPSNVSKKNQGSLLLIERPQSQNAIRVRA